MRRCLHRSLLPNTITAIRRQWSRCVRNQFPSALSQSSASCPSWPQVRLVRAGDSVLIEPTHDSSPWARVASSRCCQKSVLVIRPSVISYEFSVVTTAIAAHPCAFDPNGLSDVRPCARQRHADGQHRIVSAEHQGLSTPRTRFRISVSVTMTRDHECACCYRLPEANPGADNSVTTISGCVFKAVAYSSRVSS